MPVTQAPFSLSSIDATDWEPFLVGDTAFGEVHWIRTTSGGDNTTLFVGLWRCEPTEQPYAFNEDETIYALEGRLRIAVKGGDTIELKPGDIVSFAKGTESTWTITEQFKKLFVVSG